MNIFFKLCLVFFLIWLDFIFYSIFLFHFYAHHYIISVSEVENTLGCIFISLVEFQKTILYFWSMLLVLVLFTTPFIELMESLLMMVSQFSVASACYSIALDATFCCGLIIYLFFFIRFLHIITVLQFFLRSLLFYFNIIYFS